MRVYWVLFGIFSIHSAIVNSMWIPETGDVETLTRTKRAVEKQEHDQTNIDSAAVTRSDSETKSTKHEKDHPVKPVIEHPSIEHNLKPSTPSKPHETLKTTTLFTPLSTTMTTTTPPGPITSTHEPTQKKPTHASKAQVQNNQQHSQMPQNPYQIVPSTAVNQHFGPLLPMPFHSVHNPVQFSPIDEPPQNPVNAYRESRLQHGRSAYEDYNLGSTYQALSSGLQEAPGYHQSSPVTYAQPMVYSQQSEYQPPCGSSVLISCQPSVQQSPCSSYQSSYHVGVPSYHPQSTYHPQVNYQPQPLPNSSYREADQNGMLVEEPLVGSTHRNHHPFDYYRSIDDYYQNFGKKHHHRQHNTYHKTTTQKPETLDSIEDKPKAKVHHSLEPKAKTTGTETIKMTEENDSENFDQVKHLKVQGKKHEEVKNDDTKVGTPLMTTMSMDKSTTEEPSHEMRQMQSAEMSKQDPMQTDQMPSSIMQSSQGMPPQIPSDQMPSSAMQRNQQAEPSQIPLNQMPWSMMQSGQLIPPHILLNQMQRQQMEINQLIPQQTMSMPMNPLTLQRPQVEIPQIHPDQMQGQQMMNVPVNPVTLQRPQMEIPQMHPDQMQSQQMMNMPVNPLDSMLINPVNMRPVHEFHQSSSDEPKISMLNPMMEEPSSQSAGGSPQQMFWEPTGLYYRLI